MNDVLGALRRRWRIPLAIALVGLAAMAFVVAVYEPPVSKWSSVAEVAVDRATSQNDDNNQDEAQPSGAAVSRLDGSTSEQAELFLHPEVVAAASQAAGVRASDESITIEPQGSDSLPIVTVTVNARTEAEAEAVAQAYADAFIAQRRAIQLQELGVLETDTKADIAALQARLAQLDAQLGPPPEPLLDEDGNPLPLPPADVREPVDTALLRAQRNALGGRIESLLDQYADISTSSAAADGGARVIQVLEANELAVTSWPVGIPLAIIGLVVVALGVGGAVLADRVDRTVRTEADAADAFDAPVLVTIPRQARRRQPEPTVLKTPASPRAAAYRSLASTLVSTGRKPTYLLVASPTASPEAGAVAVNLAAGLAQIGLRVALLSTDHPAPAFVQELEAESPAKSSFASLVNDAAYGRLDVHLNGEFHSVPPLQNLWVVPPGSRTPTSLSPWAVSEVLDAFNSDKLDLCIITGYSALRSPEFSVLAHQAGSVLWVVEAGRTTDQAARAARARLDLAGATSFGVALVESGR